MLINARLSRSSSLVCLKNPFIRETVVVLTLTTMSACAPHNTDVVTGDTIKAVSGCTRRSWMEIPRDDGKGKILERKGYTACYDKESKTPRWVAWRLTIDHTGGKEQRSAMTFLPDSDVEQPRADTYDYSQSGYDRGHMCPAGDNKWDAEAMRQTFLMTNICPQRHKLNQRAWNDLEMTCRKWARLYGEIFIVCGPIYNNDRHKRIGRHKIWVPEAFFKVVMRGGGRPAALGFIYENSEAYQSITTAALSVDEVEKATGLDFFPNLDDTTEKSVEAKMALSDWR